MLELMHERWLDRQSRLCSVAAAVVVAGVGTAVGGVVSASMASGAATSAANTQANAAGAAQAQQEQEFQQTQQLLGPYSTAGTQALTQLQQLTGTAPGTNPLTAPLTAPFQPTMAQLAATPGYQFVLQQGEQGVQNTYAAQGLGRSGAALKGATNYAEGLAATTYQQQFQNYLNQNAQINNILQNQVTTGESAAAQTGALGQQAVSNITGLTTGAGAAQAAGQVGSTAAVTQGISNATGALGQASLIYALGQNTGLFGPTSTGAPPYSTSGTSANAFGLANATP